MTAREYHDRTAHSPASVRTSGHTLEWDIKPFPFKIYSDLSAIPLPREIDPLATDALAALAAPAPLAPTIGLAELTAVLYYAAGVTKKKTYPGGGEVLFRAAASTGALFQTEVYVAAGDIAGLEPVHDVRVRRQGGREPLFEREHGPRLVVAGEVGVQPLDGGDIGAAVSAPHFAQPADGDERVEQPRPEGFGHAKSP